MAEGSGGVIHRLPGYGCRHHCQGRCLYEEALNPGYHQDWRCEVLLRWEDVYEDFLNRVEAFGLDEKDLAELWAKRFERLSQDAVGCPDFSPGLTESVPECFLLAGELCVLRLPQCFGQCQHYALLTTD
jgi:hypothetical protein